MNCTLRSKRRAKKGENHEIGHCGVCSYVERFGRTDDFGEGDRYSSARVVCRSIVSPCPSFVATPCLCDDIRYCACPTVGGRDDPGSIVRGGRFCPGCGDSTV